MKVLNQKLGTAILRGLKPFSCFIIILSINAQLFISCHSNKLNSTEAFKIEFKEVDYGIGRRTVIEKEYSDNSPTGTHAIAKDFKIIKKTDRIPAELGLSFGVSFILKSKGNSSVFIEQVWTFPGEMTNENGKSYKEARYSTDKVANETTFSFYTFDKAYELMRGEWSFQVYCDGKKLYERKFYVE